MPMKKTPATCSATRLFILLFSLFVTTLSNNLDSTIIHKRVQLISENDSIDLLKQTFKRKGLSLTELEEKQRVIRDSLKMLNLQIQNTNISHSNSRLPDLIRLLSNKPETIFDWIIIVVGIIAVISGVFLISGIFSLLSSKNKASKSKKSSKKISEPPPKKLAATPQPAASPKQSIDELRALAGNTSDTVNQLRRQLKNTGTISSQPETNIRAKNLPQQEEMPPALFADPNTQDELHTQKQIIDAARNGMTPHDISIKYHMSTDQILLILKVAGVKQKK
jgi:hypothetical protein